jgi:signal transduction histidine kinase/ligand-binding sensor domain-containing protein/DNA-binding response OmpR family regulator
MNVTWRDIEQKRNRLRNYARSAWFYVSISIFLLLCCPLNSYTQPIVFSPVAPEAISNSFVRCFYKDSRGFMWFGLADGLIRYDGTNSYRYEHNPDDKASISHNSINVIVEDETQRLWIGTASGLCLYDPERDYFVNVDSLSSNKNHLNNRFITALSFDSNGRLWIGTHGGGLNIYDREAHMFTYLNDPTDGKSSSPGNYVNKLLRVDDQMWCATKGGLKLFNTAKTVSVPLTFAGGGLPTCQLTQLIPDKAGNIWVSSVNGEIFKLVPANGYYTVNQVFSGVHRFGASWNNILALNIDRKGNLWIGGENSGLNYLNTTSGVLTRYLTEEGNANVLPTNSIRSIYIDDTGLTWIGTFDRGAYLMDRQAGKFSQVRYGSFKPADLAGKGVRAFAEDHQGNVWLTMDGLGLSRIEGRTRSFQKDIAINKQLVNKFLTALICDRHGNLWIGTGGHGVYRLNLGTQELIHYTLQSGGFGDDKTSCLYADKSGTIWAGSAGSGLFYFNDKTDRFVVLREKDKSNYITHTSYVSSMVEDSDGILWVGTMYGLYALRRDADHSYSYQWFIQTDTVGSLSSSAVQVVYEDQKKNLWIGTTDNGLNVKAPGGHNFKRYGKAEGLPGNTIRSIIADATGDLWVSTNRGLSRFDQQTKRFFNHSKQDGLSSNDFYPGAALRSSTGQLFFGNNNGFNAFYPDSIQITAGKPNVYFADIKINNQTPAIGVPDSPLKKHISLTSEIELSYDQRSFTIDFVAIQFGSSMRHHYAYKLEGFDTDWHYAGTNHLATYTNIDPGHYTFLAKASAGDGTWNEVPTRLDITIRQTPWKTWWAISLYVSIIAAAMFFAVKIRIDRVNMKNQLTLERLAREREHELSESKTQFFTNISHEFRTPLSLILMPLENLISCQNVSASVKERVHTAYKNANKMMSLVNELMDFNKIESGNLKLNPRPGELVEFITNVASLFDDVADRRNITFSVRTDLDKLKGWFDRDKLERMLVNVLSNAFKFTADGGYITVIINSKRTLGSQQIATRCLELIVVDNGIGISSEEIPRIFDKFYQAKSASAVTNPGTGIGLSLTKALVELHQGTITAESSPDKETKFIITLPIDATAYLVVAHESMSDDVVHMQEGVIAADRYFVREEATAKDQYEILVVEDNEDLREYIAAELRQEFKVWQAQNGEEGARIAVEKSPDLIISDILMSQKTGIELCREIKSNIKTSHIPFILLTARVTVEDQITGIESGADVYITKPFSVRFLLTHVRNLIESRQKLYSHFSQDVYLLPSKVTSNEIDQAFLQRAVDYIVEHIQDTQLGVDAIAELFNLSRTQVYRKIKALTGKTAVEFIRTIRLKQALKLMETKQYTLSEIAYLTGFNSASYFTRSFKEEYGKAPSEYLGMAS